MSASICTIVCGDGRVISPEICDDGPASHTPIGVTSCTSNCMGSLSGYICTGGTPTTRSSCLPDCGDNIKLPEEECDDGNLIDNDGCSSTCKFEVQALVAPIAFIESVSEVNVIKI